jgi:large subunit ribosomal protein L22
MKTQATAKFVGTSARKTGLVAALIRGRRAIDARNILAVTNKRATVPVGKVLESAIANAENNHGMKAANLVIESILIGPGPTLKRSMPRAKGSSSAIRKRSSHITVVVSDGKTAAKLVSSKEEKGSAKDEKVSAKGATTEQANSGRNNGSEGDKGSLNSREVVTPEAKKQNDSKAKKESNGKKEEAK